MLRCVEFPSPSVGKPGRSPDASQVVSTRRPSAVRPGPRCTISSRLMTLPFEPAAELADPTAARSRRLAHLGTRHLGLEGRARLSRREVDRVAARLARRRLDDGAAPRSRRGARPRRARGAASEAVYLLGMGGSSLCAEVLRSVYGVAPGSPELFVLDTTDERTLTTGRGADGSGAHLDRRRQQERRHGRSRVDGALLLAAAVRGAAATRRAGSSSPSPIPAPRSSSWPPRAAIARRSSIPPTSAGAFRRCRCSDWCPRR